MTGREKEKENGERGKEMVRGMSEKEKEREANENTEENRIEKRREQRTEKENEEERKTEKRTRKERKRCDRAIFRPLAIKVSRAQVHLPPSRESVVALRSVGVCALEREFGGLRPPL